MFSGIILAIEVPLGILVALNMPKKGSGRAVCLVLMALPLLIPWNVVGTIWQIFGRVDIGLLGYTLAALGHRLQLHPGSGGRLDHDHRHGRLALDLAWWRCSPTPACSPIPDAYYQAAKIDRASALEGVPLYRAAEDAGVLLIAILLRFMDSFMIYTEPFVVTGGGPGNATTFLSIDLVKMAIGQFDLGPAAAVSLIYFLVILLISWVFYTVMTNLDEGRASDDRRASNIAETKIGRSRASTAARRDRRSTSSFCCCRSTGSST